MKTIKTLHNENQLCSEVTTEAWYPKQSSAFTMRIVFSGKENYTVGTRHFTVYPSNFLTLNEGTTYSRRIYSEVPVGTFSICFAPKFLEDFHATYISDERQLLDNPFSASKGNAPHFLESLYPFTGDLKFNILHLKKHVDAGLDNEMLLNEYLHHCLTLYYKIYNHEVILKSESLNFNSKGTRVEILKRLAAAKDFMLSNYNAPITLDDISQQACLSVNHLLRTFKQAFDCSPHQYLVKVRLNRARYLLKNTNNSVNEIVDLVGFECPSSFIRLFKGTFLVTPGCYRLQAAG